MKQCIWLCELPRKKGMWDNDYRFYDDGTIEHEHDLSIKNLNLISNIQPSEIDEMDRIEILYRIADCPKEWQTFVTNLLR